MQPLCARALGLRVRPRQPRLPLGGHGRDAGGEVRHPPDQRARRSRRRRGRRARDAQRQGGYAALDGEAFALRDGIGEDGSSTTQAIAFAPDGTGFTGGTVAFGAVTRAAPGPAAAAELLPLGDAIVAGAISPTGDGRVFALGRSSGAMLYAPGSGWARAFSAIQEIGLPPLAIAWPRKDLLIAGGSVGLLATATGEPFDLSSGFEDREIPRARLTNFRELEVQNTTLAIACTPSDPLDCVAAGLDGLLVRGDGTNWRFQALPETAPKPTHITGVAFDGRTPLLATTDGLYVGASVGRRLRARRRSSRPDDRAGPARGGAHGRDRRRRWHRGGGRFVRDSAAAPWRPTTAPLDLHPYALAAYPRHGRSRAVDRVRDVRAGPVARGVRARGRRRSA